MSLFLNRKCIFAVALVVTMIPLTLGCDGSTESASNGSETESAEARPLPSFKFHKPKEVAVAVERMRELHEAIVGDGELPGPVEYKVREVVHGSGPGGHSHFYLYDPEKGGVTDDESHEKDPFTGEGTEGDGHVTTDEKIHDVAIGPFVELKDLSRWMPDIAVDSNMAEDTWSKINDVSKVLRPIFYEVIEESSEEQARRSSYRKMADTIADQISALESLVK